MRYPLGEVGLRIRQLRGRRRQQEFAELHETSQGYISDLENGKAQPSFSFLVSLFLKESISLDWLITGKGQAHFYPDQEGEEQVAMRERTPEPYRKLDGILMERPDLSPTLSEFLDLFLKLEIRKV
ncbi:MAG: helix-turn-helix domain-containing protein [Acidobacteriota bacterium]